jgi:cell filamentation protein
VAVRVLQLWRRPPAPTRDLVELPAVHRHLFQDIYPWAGRLRTVDLRKTVSGAQPFREGNGRTQRFFFDRLAVVAGWWLDWTQITGAVNDAASRSAAEDHDLAALQEMFTPAPHRRRPRS